LNLLIREKAAVHTFYDTHAHLDYPDFAGELPQLMTEHGPPHYTDHQYRHGLGKQSKAIGLGGAV